MTTGGLLGIASWFRRRRQDAAADAPLRVLFVCSANLCRSPMAVAIARALGAREAGARAPRVDSAGTHPLPRGPATDPRVRQVVERAGFAHVRHRARGVRARDFATHDLILAMDHANLDALRARCPPADAHKLRLFLDLAPGFEGRDVPDPYFGSLDGFEHVRALCELGVRALLRATPADLKAGARS
jgi:protein-tyrosine phosphatase